MSDRVDKTPMHAIVTGASSGIGLAISKRLLLHGFDVTGISRAPERSGLKDDRFRAISIDLADLTHLPVALKALEPRDEIKALILCAGKGRFGSLEEFSFAQIEELMNLNFTANAFLVRAFVHRMKEQRQGDIIFIGSEAALRGTKKGALYCASKFALRGFAQALREECKKSGVRVTIINPGMVKSSFFDKLNFEPGETDDCYLTPDDVADAVEYVLAARQGSAIDEINLSPQKHVIRFRGRPG